MRTLNIGVFFYCFLSTLHRINSEQKILAEYTTVIQPKQQIDLFDKIRDRFETLQYILGHADISVALNTYTHVNFDMQRKKYIG